MIFVEGGEIRVNRIKGINIQTHTVVVNDFCILRGVVNHDAVSKFLYSSIEKNEYECFSEKVVKDFCYKFSRIVTPTRELEGTHFLSNEQLTHYTITNSKGSFVRGEDGFGSSKGDTILSAPDTAKAKLRTPANPKAKTTVNIPTDNNNTNHARH